MRTYLSKKPNENSVLVSLLALLILSLVFVFDQQNWLDCSRFLSANFNQVFVHHEFWRLFTAPLVHADIQHLGSNALFFGGLAFLLNGYFGYFAFPFLSFVSGGLINWIVLQGYPPEVSVVGASGIVYFMAAFWLALYIGIERGISKKRRLMNAVALAAILFVPEALQVGVSYLSHSVGFGLGAISGALFFIARRQSIRAHEVWSEVEPLLEESGSPSGEHMDMDFSCHLCR